MKSAMRKLDYEKIISEIKTWIKEYVISAKVNGIVIGISGGIDSAVTTSLCVKALGKKNVIGLDVVELSHKKDDLNSPFAVAKMIYKLIGFKFLGNPKVET